MLKNPKKLEMYAITSKAPRYLLRAISRPPYTTRAAPCLPAVITPSAQEIANKRLDARNLEKAVRHVHQDGLVVVNNVVPHTELDIVNAKMVEDARELQARGKDGPFNYNQGNLQLDAPPVKEYFFPSIFTSTFHALTRPHSSR